MSVNGCSHHLHWGWQATGGCHGLGTVASSSQCHKACIACTPLAPTAHEMYTMQSQCSNRAQEGPRWHSDNQSIVAGWRHPGLPASMRGTVSHFVSRGLHDLTAKLCSIITTLPTFGHPTREGRSLGNSSCVLASVIPQAATSL